jgi:hypothetical protein
MVFTDELHRARLGALLAHLFDEANLCIDFEFLEVGADDAVSVEVDATIVRGGNGAVILLREELYDDAVVRHVVAFDLPSSPPCVVLDPPTSGVKGIPDSDIDILVRMMLPGGARDVDRFLPLQANTDAYMVQIAPVMMAVWRLHHYPARHDIFGKLIEPSGTLSDIPLDRGGGSHAPECQLQW